MSVAKRKCTFCKEYEEPENGVTHPIGFFCSQDHAYQYSNEKQQKSREKQLKKARSIKVASDKQDRKIHRERKEALRPRSWFLAECQKAVNEFIRIRDKGLPCISCGKPDDGSHQRHASHYRSVGACSVLRFNTKNIYASCAQCNSIKSGNLIEYRIRLKAKYGEELVDWLECQNQTIKYQVETLERIKKIYRKRSRLYLKHKVG
jgi:5-methylcytosine-specific restriction endonuclease McrA